VSVPPASPGVPPYGPRLSTLHLPLRSRCAQPPPAWASAGAGEPGSPPASTARTTAAATTARILVTSRHLLSTARHRLDRELPQPPPAVHPHGRALAGHLDPRLHLDELVGGVQHRVAVVVAGREAHLVVAEALDLAVEAGGERRPAVGGGQGALAGLGVAGPRGERRGDLLAVGLVEVGQLPHERVVGVGGHRRVGDDLADDAVPL